MKRQRLISLITGVITAAQMLSIGMSASAYSGDLFEKYKDKSIYVYSGAESDVENGILQFDGDASITPNYNGYADCRLVDVDDEAAAAGLFKDAADTVIAAAKEAGIKYAAVNVDGGVMHKAATSADGVTKDAWFTTRYYRQGWGEEKGAMYFRLTGNDITVDDNDVYLLVEYLDEGTADLEIRYTTKVYASSAKDWWRAAANSASSGVFIPRNNTGKWETAVVRLTDAALSGNETHMSQLATTLEDIKIQARSIDTYISRVAIVKAADFTDSARIEYDYSAEAVSATCSADGDEVKGLMHFAGGDVVPNHASVPILYMVDVNNEAECLEHFGPNSEFIASAKAAGAKYAAVNSDGAARVTNVTSSDNVSKDAWHTSQYYREGRNALTQGYLYFRLTNNNVTTNDKDLYILIEYLDNNSRIAVNYVNKVYDSSRGNDFWNAAANSSFNQTLVQGGNTGEWKTAVIHVEDAQLSNVDRHLTPFCSSSEDIKIQADGDLYVSRIAIVKAQDVKSSKKVSYTVNGQEGFASYSAGEVAANASVMNDGEQDMKAVMYTAVYDCNGRLSVVTCSDETVIAAGTQQIMTSDTLKVENGCILKTFVWDSAMKPCVYAD